MLFNSNYSLNCKGFLLDLTMPKIMGILNITPDSFFDGGKYTSIKNALKQTEKMLREGADIIDVGGASSRPNAPIISVSEEFNRVIPIIKAITTHFPSTITSIDTVYSKVADAAIFEGAAIINDISAGNIDNNIYSIAAKHKVPYIAMHLKGTPATMTQLTNYNNFLLDITDYFIEKISNIKNAGVVDIVLDPGFGFAKTLEQNYYLLNNLSVLSTLNLPILVGISRKSMIYKALNGTAKNCLAGTITANTIALQNGANILRVHDVKAAKDTVAIWALCNKTAI